MYMSDDGTTYYYDTTGRIVECVRTQIDQSGDTIIVSRAILVENREERWEEWQVFKQDNLLVERNRTDFNADGSPIEFRRYSEGDGEIIMDERTTWLYDEYGRTLNAHQVLYPGSERRQEQRDEVYSYDTMVASTTSPFRTVVTWMWRNDQDQRLHKRVSYYDEKGMLREQLDDETYYTCFTEIAVDSAGRPIRSIRTSYYKGDTTWPRRLDTYDQRGNVVLSVEIAYKSDSDRVADIGGIEVAREEIEYRYDPYGNWTYRQWQGSGKKYESLPPVSYHRNGRSYTTMSIPAISTNEESCREFTYFPSTHLPAATIR
jgi:hypothetical protein